MVSDVRLRPPAVFGGLLRLISLMVRREGRGSWFARREADLQSLWILAERGELGGDTLTHAAWLCRDAFANAVLVRCGGFNPRRSMRGPAFLLAMSASVVFAIAAGTHWLSETRSLLYALGNTASPASQNRIAADLFPVVFALATGLIAAVRGIPLRARNGRLLAFFVVKTVLLVAVAIPLWVEGDAALRHCIPNQTLRALVGGLIPAVAFVGSFSGAVLWSLADQQHRCHVCLRRLVMPVRMGSWASVFEPVTIEWLCEDGHGALCEHATEAHTPDRWIGLEPIDALASSAR